MTPIKTLTALAAGALVLSGAAAAQAQTPYNSAPYGSQTQTSPGSVIQDLLTALLGGNQTLESEWSRGRRPLGTNRTAFEARLDAGVRDGSINRYEADRLRTDYSALVTLEARYAADGRLTTAERTELRDRYRALTERLDTGGDYPGYPGGNDWRSLAEGSAAFDARLDAAVRNRTLTRAESNRLRTDYQALVQLEVGYARNGLDARERDYLESSLAELNRRVGDNGGGYPGGGGYDNRARIAQIEADIAAGERSGSINRNEGERLRTELGDLTRLDAAYAENGLNADESAYLTRRFGELEVRVRNNIRR